MKKRFNVILILMCCFMLMISFVACNNKFDDDSKIKTPINTKYPIVGMYEVKSFDDMNIVDRVIGNISSIYFDKTSVYLDSKVYSGVTYKARTVDTNQYTVYYLKCSKDEVGLKSDKINIISIYENSNLVVDVLDAGENTILVNIDGKVVYMEKTKKNIDEIKMSIHHMQNMDKGEIGIRDKKKSSTLFLGIRNMKKDKNIDKFVEVANVYNTIGINISDEKVNKVHRAPLLIIPRKTGFWSVDNYKVETPYSFDNAFESKILNIAKEDGAYLDKNINKSSNGKYKYLGMDELHTKDIRCFPLDSALSTNRINFVSDNYVGFESVYNANNTSTLTDKERVEYYNVYTLDGINRSHVNLNNMLSVDNYHNLINIEKNLNMKNQTLESESFTLKRKNGYWCVVNKILDSDIKNTVNEIVLNIDPRKDIIKYDELPVTWSSIKNKIPFAIDGFCSPNKDVVVIITERKLYVFNVVNNVIKDKLYEMELKEGDTVIMAEWGVGEYAEKWIDVCTSY